MLLQLEHQCMRFENKGSGKSCGRYIIGHTKERCSCEMDGSVSEACSAVWHTVYTEHYRDHCRVIATQHCSAAVSVTWSAVSRPEGGRWPRWGCSLFSTSEFPCSLPRPGYRRTTLALGPNHNHNIVLSSDIFSKHKPAILNGNYAGD